MLENKYHWGGQYWRQTEAQTSMCKLGLPYGGSFWAAWTLHRKSNMTDDDCSLKTDKGKI